MRDEQNDIALRAAMELRAAFITDLCRNATVHRARGFGGEGFDAQSSFQRYFRGINMVAVHAFLNINTAAEACGLLALGRAVDHPPL